MEEKKIMTKTAKDIIESLIPKMTELISVAVATTVKQTMDQLISTEKSKTADSFHADRQAALLKNVCDRLE